MVELPKIETPVGTVVGVQFAAVLKSPEAGLASHVASCANAGAARQVPASSATIDRRKLRRGARGAVSATSEFGKARRKAPRRR